MTPHRTKLTADAVAVALVTAARLTGENPEAFADRKPDLRCRHVALHALVHCFRGVTPSQISDALGCPKKPNFFYRTSLWYTLGKAPQRYTPPADWWRDEDLDAVIRAVEAEMKIVEAAPARDDHSPAAEQKPPAWADKTVDEERPPLRRPPPVPEPAPSIKTKDLGVTRIARAVEKRESKPAPKIEHRQPERPPGPVFRRAPGGIGAGKRALYEMLGEAVRNTAKLPKEG